MSKKYGAEALYIRILLILTAVILAFVLTVFVIAGRFTEEPGTEQAGRLGGGAEPDETREAIIPSGSIPVMSDLTAVMDGARLDAENAVLVRLSDNSVIASLHADMRIYPASMTKIMTLIVACERLASLEDKVAVSAGVIAAAYTAGASCAGFAAGESVTVRDLLYGAALPSGADATDTLAVYIAGSESAFAELMNRKAAELGLKATHFVNASGLHDENHYSTVREIAAIMAYAMKNELCREVFSALTYTTSSTSEHPDGIVLYSTAFSRMSARNFGSVTIKAAKTGYTDEAKFCLASYAEDGDGKGYILVTAGGTTRHAPVYDCKYAYETFID